MGMVVTFVGGDMKENVIGARFLQRAAWLFAGLLSTIASGQTLKQVAKFDLPGPPGKRFDYLTIDEDDHYLISAHLAAGQTYVIDLNTEPHLPDRYEEALPAPLREVLHISHAGVRWRAMPPPREELELRMRRRTRQNHFPMSEVRHENARFSP